MADEVFGPILPILTYNALNEAFERIAAAPRPLAGFVFSRNQETIDRFIAGMGHYYGKYGFDALTYAKSILISPPDVAIEHLYSPFTDAKNQALQQWFEY